MRNDVREGGAPLLAALPWRRRKLHPSGRDVNRILESLESRQKVDRHSIDSLTPAASTRRPAVPDVKDNATQTSSMSRSSASGHETVHGLLTPSPSEGALSPALHTDHAEPPFDKLVMPDTPPSAASSRDRDHDRGREREEPEGLVDATRKHLAASEDILAFVQRIKEGQERDREELSAANNGRRTTLTREYDKDGTQFDGRHTSLSPLTERTEQSTRAGSKSSSAVSSSRRDFSAQLAIAYGLGITAPPLPEKPPSGRSISPCKHAVSPEMARRLQAFAGPKAAAPLPERTSVASIRSAGDLIRLFDSDSSRPASPTKSSASRSSSPTKHDRGRSDDVTHLPHLRHLPPMRKDYSPSTSKASSVVSADAMSIRSYQQPMMGELHYAPTAGPLWVVGRAALKAAELDLAYEVEGVPQSARFDLSGARKVESVRIPPQIAQEQVQGHLHIFQIIWRDPKRAPTRFGCARGVDRVEWLTRMMDVASPPSTVSSPALSRFRDPLPHSQSAPVGELGTAPGKVPGWDQPALSASVRPPSAPASEAGTVPDASLFDASDTDSIRHRKLRDKLDDIVGSTALPSAPTMDPDISEQPPLDLFDLDRRLEHRKSLRSLRSVKSNEDELVDRASLPPMSPPLPPLPLQPHLHTRSATMESLDRHSFMTSTTRSSDRLGSSSGNLASLAAGLPRISLQDAGPQVRIGEFTPPPVRRRGAWSDADRKSVQTDSLLLGGYRPGRAVARDMHKLLSMFTRQDTLSIARSQDFKPRLDDMQRQLSSIAARLRNQRDNDEVSIAASAADEPTIADKVDYMLSLCNILMESHKEMSRDVEKALRSKGVIVEEQDQQRALSSSQEPLKPDGTVLKAAALNRIEDLLQTVLSRLDGSPEDSPKQTLARSAGSSRGSSHGPSDATPRALTPKPVTPIPTVSSVRSSELEAEAERFRGGSSKGKMDLPEVPREILRVKPPSTISDSSHGTRHQARVAEQRAWTQEKLEAASTLPRGNENSRWSSTTQDPLGMSRHLSSLPRTSGSPVLARGLPQAPVMPPRARSSVSLLASADGSSSGSVTPTQPTPPPVDERMQLILQGILQALQQQQENSDTSTKQQSDVVAYLARVDNFLREDINSRSIEWQTITETLNAVKQAVEVLPAQLAAQSIAAGVVAPALPTAAPAPAIDGLPIDPAGANLTQRPSLQRRMRGSAPPEKATEGGIEGKAPLKRSLSMPRIAGPRNIRLWGGPTPTGDGRAAWQRKPAKSSDPATEASNYEFETMADAHAAFGQSPPPGSETELESYPNVPPMSYAPSSTANYVPPAMPPPMMPPSPAPTPTSAGESALAQQNMAAMGSVQAGIREVISHLRERALRDEERDRLLQEEARRAKEPSSMDKQRQLDAKAAEIRDAAKESKLDQLIDSLKKRSEEHDTLLKKIAEANGPKPPGEKEDPKSPTAEDGKKLLDNIRSGFDHQVRDFKQALSLEVRNMLTEVGALRDQKKTLQAEIAELFAFKAKHGGGGPDTGLPAYQPPLRPDAMYTGAGPTMKVPLAVNPEGRRNFGPFGGGGGGPRGPR